MTPPPTFGTALVNLMTPGASGEWPGTYKCEDKSLLFPYLNPLCEALTTLVPAWISPNVLTVAGTAAALGAAIVAAWASPTCSEEAPLWIPIMGALAPIVWLVLDTMDGKHARRTGSGSILGDWIDHALDYISLASVIQLLANITLLGCDENGFGHAVAVFACGAAAGDEYTTWWARRYTGKVSLGQVGMTEFVVIAAFLCLFSAVRPKTWVVIVGSIYDVQIQRNHFCWLFFSLMFILSATVANITNVVKHPAISSKIQYRETLVSLWPLGLFLASTSCAVVLMSRCNLPFPSLATTSFGYIANAWPLASIQLLSSLSGAPPSPYINLFLALAPFGYVAMHVQFPNHGFLVASIVMGCIVTMCKFFITKELQRYARVPSLWILKAKKDR